MPTATTTRPASDLTSAEYWWSLNRKSLLRFFLIAELNKRPMHGYDIAGSIAVCCDGVRPTDAMIYTTLHELEAGGYIDCESTQASGRHRRMCTLTERGWQAYRAAAETWAFTLPQLESAVKAAGVETTCCAAPVTFVTEEPR